MRNERLTLFTAAATASLLWGCSAQGSGGPEPNLSERFGGSGATLVRSDTLPSALTYNVLHTFGASGDGAVPVGDVTADKNGNIYGATQSGADSGVDGTVFEIAAGGKESVLFSFESSHPNDGLVPLQGVVRDGAGNLYGTTNEGGSANDGVVYKLSPSGVEKVLHTFNGVPDGANPIAHLIRDTSGNLYGTTEFGGTKGYGTIFKVDRAGSESILYSFTNGSDGAYPVAGVARDASGNLYCTTMVADSGAEPGTVFKLSASFAPSTLYTFTGGNDGGVPESQLVLDTAGNVYGTTVSFGTAGDGVVFRVSPSGTETVLHEFTGGSDGAVPYAGVVRISSGVIYGTTFYGGGALNAGTIYKISIKGHETVLYDFSASSGYHPNGVLLDDKGSLYGTASSGGIGSTAEGVVFKLSLSK